MNFIKAIIALSAVFSITISEHVFAADRCSNLFHIQKKSAQGQLSVNEYGILSQNDPYFFQKGMNFNSEKTQLCGPVCIYNVVEKVRRDHNPSYKISSRPTELKSRIIDHFSLLNKSPEQVYKGGITIYELQEVLGLVLSTENFKYKQIKKDLNNLKDSIRPEDFLKKNNFSTSVVLIGQYENDQRINGHFIIISKIDPKENKIYGIDPESPELNLVIPYKIFKKLNGQETLQIVFENKNSDPIIIFDSMLQINKVNQ